VGNREQPIRSRASHRQNTPAAAPDYRPAAHQERMEMKSIKFAVPLMILLTFALFLSGCPGKGKMMGDGIKKEAAMDKR
jgi:hypothetical protein